MIYELIKKTETIGCVFEDGADTRKTTICFLLIPTDKKDEFGEYIASECGSQDYSYQVDFKTIGFFSELELTQIEELIQDKLGKTAKVYCCDCDKEIEVERTFIECSNNRCEKIVEKIQ
jgi:hypothetical protein